MQLATLVKVGSQISLDPDFSRTDPEFSRIDPGFSRIDPGDKIGKVFLQRLGSDLVVQSSR